MPRYEITSPDGKKFEITAPDGATQEQVLAYAQEQFKQQPKERAIGDVLPNMGVGEGALSLATGAIAAPLSGLAGIVTGGNPQAVEGVQRALTYQPRSEIGKGIVNTVSAPFEWLAGQADKAGTKVLDATGSPALATATKVGVESIPMAVSGVAGAVKPVRGVKPAAIAAADRGFTMTPGDMGAGVLSRAGASIAGEPRLARHISQKNQPIYNEKIAKDLGLPKETPLDLETVQGVRTQAHSAYEAARKLGSVTFDDALTADLNKIVADRAKAESAFGGKSPITEAVDSLRINGADADAVVSKINNLRKDADAAFANRNTELGRALRDSAWAMERQLIRHAERAGQPEVVKAMKEARTLIAKTYMAEGSLQGGNINPQKYAKALQKGKPLTGGSREVAEFADQFPRSSMPTRNIGEAGATWADLALGGLSGEVHALYARPLLRGIQSSGPGQAAMMNTPALLEAIRKGQAAPLTGLLEMGLEQ